MGQRRIPFARQVILALIFLFSLPGVLAQVPPADDRDGLDSTIGIFGDPDASQPQEIVRKIPPRKVRQAGDGVDSSARDLASPGDEAGHGSIPIDPILPGDSGSPSVPGSPDPGGGLTPPEPPAAPAPAGKPPKPPHDPKPPRDPKPPDPKHDPKPDPKPGPGHGPGHPRPPPDRPDRPDHPEHKPRERR
jgi:hypothetical protein